ncbi:unnamed protein product [Acanthosepion pharaonis]|uniref:CCHC-type domain-containing protein n=1 Tax=Acanthosepion pharaonis TaxID=158019 RepID=A0A812CYC1_ACAPH|nr:unnamed protein product [Sepia pharaonis]
MRRKTKRTTTSPTTLLLTDCRSRSDVGGGSSRRTRARLRCYLCNELGHEAQDCSGNESEDKVLSQPLPPLEGKRCSALGDTGCSRSILCADRCVTWSSQQIEIRTIDGVSRACCCVGTVSILTDGGNHAKVDVLVARQRPLGYDLLLGIDAIRALGGMIITPAGNVELDFPLFLPCYLLFIVFYFSLNFYLLSLSASDAFFSNIFLHNSFINFIVFLSSILFFNCFFSFLLSFIVFSLSLILSFSFIFCFFIYNFFLPFIFCIFLSFFHSTCYLILILFFFHISSVLLNQPTFLYHSRK